MHHFVPLLPIPLLALAAGPAIGATACFEAGITALDAGRFADAAEAFEAAARQPACAADAPDLHFNAAFAWQKLADADGSDAACRAVARYREVVASTPDPELARTARARIAALEPRCAPPPTAGGWALRSAIAAGVAGVGTAVVYALALDADEQRAAARADYITLRRANRPADAEDARRRFEDARNSTDALGITAYVGLGLTLALAGLAVGGWLSSDTPASVSVGPNSVGLQVRW